MLFMSIGSMSLVAMFSTRCFNRKAKLIRNLRALTVTFDFLTEITLRLYAILWVRCSFLRNGVHIFMLNYCISAVLIHRESKD